MVAVISFSSKSRKKLGLHAEVMNTIDQVYIDLYTLTVTKSLNKSQISEGII